MAKNHQVNRFPWVAQETRTSVICPESFEQLLMQLHDILLRSSSPSNARCCR